MTNLKKKSVKTDTKAEPGPDAWARFEKAIHKIAPPRKAKAKKTARKK